MTTIAMFEIVCAVFMVILFVFQLTERDAGKCARMLLVETFAVILWLFIDAVTFYTNLSFFPTLLSYVWGNFVALIFLLCCDAYINEKTTLNRWVFRIPEILCLLNAVAAAEAFAAGEVLSYENGVAKDFHGLPTYLEISQFIVMLWPIVVVYLKRKYAGLKSLALLVFFAITPLFASFISVWLQDDYTVIFSAVSLMAVVIFLQNERRRINMEERAAHKALAENSVRFFALEDNFESLYDVELDSGNYEVYVKGDFYRKNVMDKLALSRDFFAELHQNIDAVVFDNDRESLHNFMNRDSIRKELSKNNHSDHYYRVNAESGPTWFKMRLVYKDADKKNVIIGVFNASLEMLMKEKETEETRKLIDGIAASYNLAYSVDMRLDSFKVLRADDSIIGSDKTFNSFSESRDFFIGLLPESDREGMRRELDYDTIRKKLKEHRSYDVEYRLPIDKAIIWHIMNVTYVDSDTIALGFANRDLEITQRHLEDKRFNEYFALYEIDIDSGMMKIVKDSPNYGLGRVGSAVQYKPSILKFALWFDKEPREFFEKMADLEYVKEQFATEDKRTFTYRSNVIKEKKWVDCSCYVTLRHSDGTPAMFTFGFSLLDSLGVYRQELQQKFVEQNAVLVSQQNELKQARVAADAANQAKTNFLFSMSHDIRTPMNAIRGFTSMAKKHVDDSEKIVEYLDKIDVSGQQLLLLINQVLEMARIESGKVKFGEKPVNLQEELNSVMIILSEQAKSKALKFVYSLDRIEHKFVLADEARIGSIVLNIVGNSMKYTPEGGCVVFSLNEIQGRKSGYATFVFTISDSGIGMSEDYLKELYEPFTREKCSTVSKIQGSGLGMSIVKNIIDLMGGNIEVQSEVNRGTRFDITIDLKIDENAGIATENEEVANVSFKGRRVLLVEDNVMNREIARDVLEERGIIVEDAEDGDVAVAKVRAAVDRGEVHYFDFILMDVQMPRMNGYEATRAIRAIPGIGGEHIPIIAMTANAFDEDRKNALAAGMDEHLAKPIDVQKTFRVLAKFLK